MIAITRRTSIGIVFSLGLVAVTCVGTAASTPPSANLPESAGAADAYNPTGRATGELYESSWEAVGTERISLGQVVSSDAPLRETVPHLTVTGNAEIKKPADQLNLSLGVTSQSQEAQTAIDENSRTMQQVVAAIEQTGLNKSEYKTGRFQVMPMYSHQPPRGAPENWQPKITGYQVTNTLEIKTKKIDKTGKIIQAATEAGANMVESIWFDLADLRKHRAEAIAEAAANARADAAALSGAAGVTLLRVLSINLDNAMPQPMYAMRGMQDMAMEGAGVSSAEPPIEPGDVSVHANVTIVYEIAQAQ